LRLPRLRIIRLLPVLRVLALIVILFGAATAVRSFRSV
jgi:hypothetical protein